MVIEHKSKLRIDNDLQFSISTPIFSIAAMELKPGDAAFISPQLIVLKEMGTIDVTVELKLLPRSPRPMSTSTTAATPIIPSLLQVVTSSTVTSSSTVATYSFGASYNIVIVKEPDGVKQILDNQKKSFFKSHIKAAIEQKDLDTLSILFSPDNKDILEDPYFFNEVNKDNLAERGLELYDAGVDLFKKLKDAADTYSMEKIKQYSAEVAAFHIHSQ